MRGSAVCKYRTLWGQRTVVQPGCRLPAVQWAQDQIDYPFAPGPRGGGPDQDRRRADVPASCAPGCGFLAADRDHYLRPQKRGRLRLGAPDREFLRRQAAQWARRAEFRHRHPGYRLGSRSGGGRERPNPGSQRLLPDEEPVSDRWCQRNDGHHHHQAYRHFRRRSRGHPAGRPARSHETGRSHERLRLGVAGD